uniref:Pigment-dispersing factor II n=1 Tax=Ooperipatus hispidus TaxID=1198994 RepID=A0A0D3QSY0_9BILA|nr:pigment-dispersing factor II precursor [Ooperipatus hispidus]
MKSAVFAICLIIFAVVLVSINAEYGQESEYDNLVSKLLNRVLTQKRNAELINSLLNSPKKLEDAGK